MRTPNLLLLAIWLGLSLAGVINGTTDERGARLDRRIRPSSPQGAQQAGAQFGENAAPSYRQFIKEQLSPPPPPDTPEVPDVPVIETEVTNTVETTTETTVEVEEEEIVPEIPIPPPPPPHHHHHYHPHHHHHHHCDFRHHRHDCPPECVADCAPHCPVHCPPECVLCLTDRVTHRLASTWLYFSINLNKRLALETLAEDFVFLSDSDNFAGNGAGGPQGLFPTGTPLYMNRDEFIRAQPSNRLVPVEPGSAQVMPIPDPFVILDVFHDCRKIAVRWLLPVPDYTGLPDRTVDVRGIDILLVRPYKCRWRIVRAWSEYNNLLQVGTQGLCDSRCSTLTPSMMQKRSWTGEDLGKTGEILLPRGNSTMRDVNQVDDDDLGEFVDILSNLEYA